MVCNAPDYSPHSVAEFAVGLLASINRNIYKAGIRTRQQNFSIRGLIGHDMNTKTVGVIGTGAIGAVFARIMAGFDSRVLLFDLNQNPDLPGTYVDFDTLIAESDVISLHLPSNPATKHIINADVMTRMKDDAIIINVSRGTLIDSNALIDALKAGKFTGVGLDTIEGEEHIFYNDLSDAPLQSELMSRLIQFPNVLVTSHMAYFTHEANVSNSNKTILNAITFLKGE
jgi:D-lactate dehydrogenase